MLVNQLVGVAFITAARSVLTYATSGGSARYAAKWHAAQLRSLTFDSYVLGYLCI